MSNQMVEKSKISPKIKCILEQFVKMKKDIYDIPEDEFDIKVETFLTSVSDVKFKFGKQDNWNAGYDANNKIVYLGKRIYQNFLDKKVNNKDVVAIMHELSHAWDFEGNSKTTGIIRRTRDNKKYRYLNEAINEAKTKILNINAVYDSKEGKVSKTDFDGYKLLQSVFDRLYTVIGMNRLDFLRAIEGKKIDEIASVLSQKTGNGIDEGLKYINSLSESAKKIMQYNSVSLNKKKSKEKRREANKSIFTEYELLDQKAYDYFDKSDLKNDERVKLRLRYISESCDKMKEKTVNSETVEENFDYEGETIDFNSLLSEINLINELPEVEYGLIDKLKQLKKRLFNKNKSLTQGVSNSTETRNKKESDISELKDGVNGIDEQLNYYNKEVDKYKGNEKNLHIPNDKM